MVFKYHSGYWQPTPKHSLMNGVIL